MEEENNVQSQETSTVTERKGFNIASMILGIIGIVTVCWWYITVPCSIMAIIFSIAGKKDAGRGMGVAGLVLGIVALALLAIIYVLALIGVAALSTSLY